MGRVADIAEVLLELGLSASATDEERAITNTSLDRAEAAVRRYIGYDPVQASRTEYYPQATLRSARREGVWEVSSDQAVLRQISEASTDELQLQHIPVRSITSLFIDYDGRAGTQTGAFAAETEKTEGTDFWPNYTLNDSGGNSVCMDGIIRSTGLWPVTAGTVMIIYTSGYSDAELHGQDTVIDASPILEAVVSTAIRRARRIFARMKHAHGFIAGTIKAERLGDYSYAVDEASAKDLTGGGDLTPDVKEQLSNYINYGWQL